MHSFKVKKHYIIRDSLSFWLLLINYTFMLFVIYNAAELLRQMRTEAALTERYNYQVMAEIKTENAEGAEQKTAEDLLQYMEEHSQHHLKLVTSLPAGEGINTFDITIVFSNRERLAPIQKQKSGEKTGGLYIGETMQDETMQINGVQCFTLAKDSYPVTGIYENDVAGGYDNRITVFWNTLTKRSKEVVRRKLASRMQLDMSIIMVIDSNENLKDTYHNIKADLAERGIRCLVTDSVSGSNYQSRLYVILNQAGSVGILCFAVLNCYMVTLVWVKRRTKEFMIRKAFGFGTGRLAMLLFQDIFKCIICAIPVIAVLEFLYVRIWEESLQVNEYSVLKYMVIMLGIVMTILFSMLFSLWKIYHMNPVEGMRGV